MVGLKVGLLGDGSSIVARRLGELNADEKVVIEELPAPRATWATYQLVVAVDARDDEAHRAAADVWLDGSESVDALWHDRVVPFATNLEAGRRAPRQQRPVVLDPDPTWPAQARRLIARLDAAVGDRTIRIDHIGSTSVPGLPAKDLIDIQAVVTDLEVATRVAEASRAAGFVRVRGPLFGTDRHGTDHEEAVVVDADPGRPVNVNIRPVTAPIWRGVLLLRDWLRAEPEARAEYAALKHELVERPGRDVNEYGEAKLPWISGALGRAEAWAREAGWTP